MVTSFPLQTSTESMEVIIVGGIYINPLPAQPPQNLWWLKYLATYTSISPSRPQSSHNLWRLQHFVTYTPNLPPNTRQQLQNGHNLNKHATLLHAETGEPSFQSIKSKVK